MHKTNPTGCGMTFDSRSRYVDSGHGISFSYTSFDVAPDGAVNDGHDLGCMAIRSSTRRAIQ